MENRETDTPQDRFLPRLRFRLPLDPARLMRARERIRDYLQAHSSDDRTIDEVVLSVEEACTNAIRHSGSKEPMTISLRFHDADLQAEVRDEGNGFDLASFDPSVPPDLLAEHGRGLYLIARMMDELALRNDDGLWVRMVKREVLDRSPRARLFGELGDVKANEELVRLETRRRALLEEIDEAFMALDWEYRIVHVNAAMLDLSHRTRDQLLGRVPWEIEPGLAGTPLIRACVDAMELGRPTILEQQSLVTGDWLEARVYPTQAGASVYLRDINRRKLVERQRDHLLRRVATERARLASVLQSMTEGVIVTDTRGNVMEMNAAALRLHGLSSVHEARRALEEWPEFELSATDGGPLRSEEYPLPRAIRGERFVDLELRVVNKRTGQRGVWSFSGAPVPNERGETEMTVLTIRDISQRRHAQTQRDEAVVALEAERARLREIIEALPVGIGLVDGDGTVLAINQANNRVWAGELPKATSIEGYAVYEGRHHDTGLPMQPHEWPAARVVVTGEPAEEIVDITRLDGLPAVIRVRAVPVLDDAGALSRIVVLTEDVTEEVGRQGRDAAA